MAAPTPTALTERESPLFSSLVLSITTYSFPQFPPNCRFVFPTTRLGPESQFSDFLDGLGPAQIVGRQTLATPPMGMAAVITFLSLLHYVFHPALMPHLQICEPLTTEYLIDAAHQRANTVKMLASK